MCRVEPQWCPSLEWYWSSKDPFLHFYWDFTLTRANKMKSLASGHRSASKSVRWFFIYLFIFLPPSDIQDFCKRRYWNQTKFPIHKVWWLREASHNRANIHTPMWKSWLKHSMAESQSIQQFWPFHSKNKMQTCGSEPMHGDQKPNRSSFANITNVVHSPF